MSSLDLTSHLPLEFLSSSNIHTYLKCFGASGIGGSFHVDDGQLPDAEMGSRLFENVARLSTVHCVYSIFIFIYFLFIKPVAVPFPYQKLW